MGARIDYLKVARGAYEAMLGLEKYLHQCGLEESLLNLIKLRASQVNGCAYCLDMHWKDLRAAGETEQRLYGLDAWEESPYYSDRERAALAWTEALTNIQEGHVSDEVYEQVRKFFTEKELADLTLAITAINGWNRLNIAARTVAGTYQPANTEALLKKRTATTPGPSIEEDSRMRNSAIDTEVLIVGAGPVGLFLANECARRGLRWRLIEAHSSQSEQSKALAIFPRTLEIFDMAGIVAPLLETANRVTSVAVMAHGRTLAHMRFTPEESPYSFVAMVPQDVTEKLLLEELRRKGGDVEYETTFLSADQQDDRVSVTVDRKGEPTKLRASFVIGCDGAHSAVRHLLNIPFEGAAYEASFMLADVQTNETLPADELQLCPSEFGPVAIFPMSAARRRIVATIEHPEGDAPSLDLVQKILGQRAPSEIKARALHWSSYFRIHHRHVAQLRVGRMFIAGDAAHIHSPFGGQGMNIGLHDVWNLVWKLDLFLRGRGNERLLDSYSAERLPVIKNVIETTDLLTKVMGTPNKFAQALRDTVIPMVSRLAPFQHAFVQRLSELGIAYPGSPIVEGPGKRYFDDSMGGGKGISSRFLVMIDDDTDSSTKEAAKQLCESFSDIVELRSSRNSGITLVRPDGYIAYATHSRGGSPALASLRSVLERQTDQSNSPAPHNIGGSVGG
jgi:AhpD family alkylhydroperoxidase